ncbi:MAG: hypothetical protein HY259_11135 [Chloroflexi bacterium]|nr:hypothetical protein [Chloroflexota bacterium]MBI3733992.1 hypothetical protein [Chloroflexota bacterium]
MAKLFHIRWGTTLLVTAALALVVVVSAACGASAPPVEQTYPILGKVILTADLVRGSKNPLGAVCEFNGQFARGEDIVVRVKILDPKTEKYLTDKEMKAVKFYLKDGTTADLHYGGHPGGANAVPTDFFWTAGWQIPANYPTGATGWWVDAESNDGRKGRFDPPVVASSALTIIERPAGK